MYGFIDGSDGRFNSVEDAMSEVEKYVLNIDYSPEVSSDAIDDLNDFSFFSIGAEKAQELYNKVNSEWEIHPYDPKYLYSGEGLLAPLKVFGKRVVRKLIGWYIRPMVEDLNAYNADALRMMNEHKKALGKLNRENRRLAKEREMRKHYDDFYAAYASTQKEEGRKATAIYAMYGDLLKEKSKIVDLGCGCGDLLVALQERGVTRCYGVDRNAALVQQCYARGVQALHEDAVEHLSNLKDGSVEAIACIHLFEDNGSEYAFGLLGQAYQKLEDDGLLLIEACNPLMLGTSDNDYFVDPNRLTSIHPSVLASMVEHVGFRIENTSIEESMDLLDDKSIDELHALLTSSGNYVLICRKSSK